MAGLTKLAAVNQILEAVKQFPVTALDTGGTSDAARAEAVLDRELTAILSNGWHENTDVNKEHKLATKNIAVTGAGTFEAGETVTESTSGATGIFYQINASNKMELVPVSGTFTGGETLTGGTSGATATGGTLTTVTTSEIVVPADTLAIDSAGTSAWRDISLRAGKLYDNDNLTFTFTDNVFCDVVRDLDFADLTPEMREYATCSASLIYHRRIVGGNGQDNFLREELDRAHRMIHRREASNRDVNLANTAFGRSITGTQFYVTPR